MKPEITSLQNPLIKHVLSLQKKRERKQEGLFLVEGEPEVALAKKSSFVIVSLFFCRSLMKHSALSLLSELDKDIEFIPCAEHVFRKISYRDNPDGFLAIVEAKTWDFSDLVCQRDSFFIILEKLEKPGNLGAILRSSDASGAAGVIVIDEGVDVFNPNVIHASRGAFFSMPLVVSTPEKCLEWLKKNKIVTVAATPEASLSYQDFSLKLPCCFILGREHEGLSSFWKDHADYLVKIPMQGRVDSLNVSVASALLLFEAQRWKSQK